MTGLTTAKYKKFPLSRAYLNAINSTATIKLVIVGRDPYPKCPTGIPFMKKEWSDLDGRSAGFHVINSLVDKFPPTKKFKSPIDFAFFVLDFGVVFLNASYHYLCSETISKKRHYSFIESAFVTNFPILERANRVLLCGDAAKMLRLVTGLDEINGLAVPHPALQGRNSNKFDKQAWDHYWSAHKLNVCASI